MADKTIKKDKTIPYLISRANKSGGVDILHPETEVASIVDINEKYVDKDTYQIISGAKYFTGDFATLNVAYIRNVIPGMNEDNLYNIGSANYSYAGVYSYAYPFPKIISNGMNEIQQGILDTTSADRFAFIPARNIIIEESVDGGTTWTTRNAADWEKENLFIGTDYDGFLALPTIDGKCNTNCLVRVTITAMNYSVPEGTSDSDRYQYWNEDYVTDGERYCNPKLLSVWVASTGNHIQLKVEGHDGWKDTTWNTIRTFDGLTGWTGRNMCSLDKNGIFFGGAPAQKANYWNWRFTFRTQTNDNDFDNSKLASTNAQYVYGIRAFSVNTWNAPNKLMESGHLYSWDRFQTMILPGHIIPKTANSNYCGTGSNQFLQVHGKEIWENGTTLKDKYLEKANITSGSFKIYTAGYENGVSKTYMMAYDVQPFGTTIAQRHGEGQLRVSAPVEETDAVNLKYFNSNKGSQLYLHKVNIAEDVSASGGYLVVISKTQAAYTSLADLGNDIVNYNKIISVRYAPAELNGKGYYNLSNVLYENSAITANAIDTTNNIIKFKYTNFGSDSVTAL